MKSKKVFVKHKKTDGRDGIPIGKNRLPEGCIRDIDRSVIDYRDPRIGETVWGDT